MEPSTTPSSSLSIPVSRFKGYFDLYNIPFEHIDRFDFTEKKSPLQAGGMNRGSNIFDRLKEGGIPHFVSDPDRSEEENRAALESELGSGEIDFAFILETGMERDEDGVVLGSTRLSDSQRLHRKGDATREAGSLVGPMTAAHSPSAISVFKFMYWAGLDGLLHRVGNDSSEVPAKLRHYERWIADLAAKAKERYDEVKLYVFSDHGMANCDEHLDLKAVIEALPLSFGKDYAVVYDSTMARFWFFNEAARDQITAALGAVRQGRIMPTEELKRLRAHFEDGQFGELIFLVKEGVLIVPSHMGERPIRAMHGYHPEDAHSHAALFTNQATLPAEVTHIPHLHRLMTHSIAA